MQAEVEVEDMGLDMVGRVVVVVEVVVIGAQVLDRVEATKSVEVLRGSSMMTCYPGNNARYIR